MENKQQPTQNTQPQNNNQGAYYSHQQINNVSVGDWMLTLFIMIIPFINIVMLFVWAFGGSPKVSKANWAKASLLWMLIGIIFSIVIIIVIGGAYLSNLFSELDII